MLLLRRRTQNLTIIDQERLELKQFYVYLESHDYQMNLVNIHYFIIFFNFLFDSRYHYGIIGAIVQMSLL